MPRPRTACALRAARRPVVGAHPVARLITNLGKKLSDIDLEPATVNHGLGAVLRIGGRVLGAVSADVAGVKVTAIRVVLNPDKLGAITEPPALI